MVTYFRVALRFPAYKLEVRKWAPGKNISIELRAERRTNLLALMLLRFVQRRLELGTNMTHYFEFNLYTHTHTHTHIYIYIFEQLYRASVIISFNEPTNTQLISINYVFVSSVYYIYLLNYSMQQSPP